MNDHVKFIPREVGDLKFKPALLREGVYMTADNDAVEILKTVKGFKVFQLVYKDVELRHLEWKECGISFHDPSLGSASKLEREIGAPMSELRALAGIQPRDEAPEKVSWWRRLFR